MAEVFTPVTLTSLTNQTSAIQVINNNFASLATLLQDVLSRSGISPNQLSSNLDMNSNRILNLPAPIGFAEPLRLQDALTPPQLTIVQSGVVASSLAQSLLQQTTALSMRQVLGVPSSPVINVMDQGAVGDGVHDDTSAIQASINALPASGGTVFFPVGVYKITNTLVIGNGTSASVSTKQGVVLLGAGVPVNTAFPGYTATGGPKLLWAGGSNNTMVKVAGPLLGWGVQNLTFDGQSTAGLNGLNPISAMHGDCRNLVFHKVFRGVVSTTVEVFGAVTNTDCFHNSYYKTLFNFPDLAGGTMGFLLTGSGSVSPTSDTDFNKIIDTTVLCNSLANQSYVFYLQVCDSNIIDTVHVTGGFANLVGVNFDYSINNLFPNANFVSYIDTGNSATTPYGIAGTPGVTGLNYLYGVAEGNSGSAPHGILGLGYGSSVLSQGDIRLTAQTAAVGPSTLINYGLFGAAMYRVSYYLVNTAAGTAGNIKFQINYNDLGGAQSPQSAAINVNPGGQFTQGTFMVRPQGGTLTYQTVFSGITGNPQYALFVKVEKLD